MSNETTITTHLQNKFGDRIIIKKMKNDGGEAGWMIGAEYMHAGRISFQTKFWFADKAAAVAFTKTPSHFYGFKMTFADAEGERLYNQLQKIGKMIGAI